jgi:hypothetical protein
MEPEVFDFRFAVPARILIIANSNCGKTFLILDLIDKRETVFTEPFELVYFVYASNQKVFKEFSEKHPDVIFTQTVPDIPEGNSKNILVVFDDFLLLHESKDNKFITDYFIRLSHHLNVTVICSWQTLFPKQLKTVSNNASYMIIFPLRRDVSALDILNRQILPDYPKFLRAVVNDIKHCKYSYLLIDNTASQLERFRYRNFVYPTIDAKVYTPVTN